MAGVISEDEVLLKQGEPPNQYNGGPYQMGHRTQTCTQRECHVKVRITVPPAEELPDARREARNTSFPHASKGARP